MFSDGLRSEHYIARAAVMYWRSRRMCIHANVFHVPDRGEVRSYHVRTEYIQRESEKIRHVTAQKFSVLNDDAAVRRQDKAMYSSISKPIGPHVREVEHSCGYHASSGDC
jgi:hypothetical protein